jgi:hypothetical protein
MARPVKHTTKEEWKRANATWQAELRESRKAWPQPEILSS